MLPTAPRSAHHLIAFVVQTALASWPAVRYAVAAVTETVRTAPTAANHEFGWVLFDRVPRAVHKNATDPPGAVFESYARQLTGPPAGTTVDAPAVLDAGLAMAYHLAWEFAQQHRDGLPVAVDLLAVAGAGCDLAAAALDEIASDRRVQLALVTYETDVDAGPRADLDHVVLSSPDDDAGLAAAWHGGLLRMAARRKLPLDLG